MISHLQKKINLNIVSIAVLLTYPQDDLKYQYQINKFLKGY